VQSCPGKRERSLNRESGTAPVRRSCAWQCCSEGRTGAREPEVGPTLFWREIVWTPSAGQGRFWLRTVMPVAGLCPAYSRGQWPLALMDDRLPRLPFGFRARCASPRSGFASVVGPTDGPSPPSPCLSERHLPLILDHAACGCGAR
jgi:hypothetical protein